MSFLQDYFPAALADLIQRAAEIKPKLTIKYPIVLLLTAQGELFKKNVEDEVFKLIYNGPIQDMKVEEWGIYCITLNAKIIFLTIEGVIQKILPLENVTTITLTELLIATTNDGSLYEIPGEEGEETGYTLLNQIKQPIIAVAPDPFESTQDLNNFFLLTLDMKVLYYNSYDEDAIVVPNVEDITNITSELLSRIDGSVYEYHSSEVEFEFVLNKTVTNAVTVQFSIGENSDYTFITEAGELFHKSTDGDTPNQPYKRVITGGASQAARTSSLRPRRSSHRTGANDVKIIAVAPDFLLTVIRADGRVLIGKPNDNDEPVLTTIPRFSAF